MGPRTTPRSQMMFMRSCTPLTPWGILVKSSLPMAFCLVLKGRWSEATMFSVSLREDGTALLMAQLGQLGHSQPLAWQAAGSGVPRELSAQGVEHPCRGVPRELSTLGVGWLGSSAHRQQGAQGAQHLGTP